MSNADAAVQQINAELELGDELDDFVDIEGASASPMDTPMPPGTGRNLWGTSSYAGSPAQGRTVRTGELYLSLCLLNF